MKFKKIIIPIILIILLIVFIGIGLTNKTFFKTKYIGVVGQEIFIPRFSYFKEECCMTAATFYSLKGKKQLNKEIKKYLKDFKYFENDETYGYKKGNLFIQSYEVEDKGLYREIYITY